MTDPYNLQRFVDAQKSVYDRVLHELRAGAKESHWMWFVFPQIAGLGRSLTAVLYAMSSLDEAKAYLAHPVLGPRLRECSKLLLETQGRTARQIFGAVDALKFRSSMTLFMRAAPEEPLFAECLRKFFAGSPQFRDAREAFWLSRSRCDRAGVGGGRRLAEGVMTPSAPAGRRSSMRWRSALWDSR